jgi:signal transduction histidine kinase/DNA-binding response OmpR family regulator
MIRFWLRCFFLGFLTCLSVCTGAQNAVFEKITIEQGLSTGMAYDILQTRDGFLWAGLEAGLNRYDGYNVKVFMHNDKQPFSIAENRVTAFLEDSRGWLWLGLFSKGVDVYDARTGLFHHFPLDFDVANNLGEQGRCIVETPDGDIWVLLLNGKGLYRISVPEAWESGLPYEPDLQRLTKVTNVALPQLVHSPKKDGYSNGNLFFQPGGALSIAVANGQFNIDPKTMAVQRVNEGLLPNSIIYAEQGDLAYGGDLWAVNENGLWRVRQGQTAFFKIPQSEQPERCMFRRGKEGHVWFIFHHKMWDLAPGEDFDSEHPDLILDATPNGCTYDQAGNFWVGTIGYGLRKINALQRFFHVGFTVGPVVGLWADKGRYFVKGFYDIRSYDPRTGKLSEQLAFNDAKMRQITLAFEPSGAVWLLCDDANSAKSMLRRYPKGSAQADRIHTFEAQIAGVTPLHRTPDGVLWIAADNELLVRFDPVSAHFDYFNYEYLFQKKNEMKRVLYLTQDANGTIWIGTERGLVKAVLTEKGMDFQLIKADPNNPMALNHNIVAGIVPDPSAPSDRLWLATKGGGVNIFDIKTGQCRHITTANGLLNDVVYGILPGSRKGEFWCSTNRGLARIAVLPDAPNGELRVKINTFTTKVGLQGNEFNTQAFSKSDNGELLFGGPNGLNHFFPDDIHPDAPTPPMVRIVGLEINHEKVDFEGPGGLLSMPLENLHELHLNYGQNNVSFEFAALDFSDPSKNCYRYRLVGLDPDWVEANNLHFANFSHLAPGKYTLRVQGNNGESDWGEAQPLVIVVHPPWWRSNLAYLCYFLLLAWGGYRAYQFQIRRVKEREQRAFEYRETERVKALEQVKTNFFTNVTHEFRTPLTLIVEPLRQLLGNPNDPERAEKIRLAEGNSRKLLGLVNQLLDMAKLESGSMALDLRRGDLGQTVRDVFETFLPLAEKHGVYLTLHGVDLTTFQMSNLEFDAGKVELVLNNLISNALKFTPAGGKVHVECKMEHLEPETPTAMLNAQYSIRISDTGIGIPTAALPKIFDRFYQVDGSHTRSGEGTGIGLALSKELAELMGGSIAVESEVGKGSVFTFWISIVVSSDLATFEKGSNPSELPVALVVEDNADLRQFIKISLGADWQVVEAADGEEGVRKAIELLPDLIISDLMMPHKDGFALCDELKNHELTAHIPIILLTAKTTIDAKLKGLRTGADDYLTKPFNTEELLTRMTNLVEARRRLLRIFEQKNAAIAPLKNTSDEPAASDFLSELDRAFLEKANRVLEEHLANEQFSVDDFALKMLISRAQLYRKIKALTDQNTSDYIRRYRLNRAYRMLKSGTGRVGEVSLLVGFGNEKYFSTVFKEHFGVSPSQVGP